MPAKKLPNHPILYFSKSSLIFFKSLFEQKVKFSTGCLCVYPKPDAATTPEEERSVSTGALKRCFEKKYINISIIEHFIVIKNLISKITMSATKND